MALADSDQKATGLKGCGKKLRSQDGWFRVESGSWRNREINDPFGMDSECGRISNFLGGVRWLCDRCAKQQGAVW